MIEKEFKNKYFCEFQNIDNLCWKVHKNATHKLICNICPYSKEFIKKHDGDCMFSPETRNEFNYEDYLNARIEKINKNCYWFDECNFIG